MSFFWLHKDKIVVNQLKKSNRYCLYKIFILIRFLLVNLNFFKLIFFLFQSFYIRCTKDGEPTFTCQCNGNCDIAKQGRIRCQYCRYQRCIMAGMCRKGNYLIRLCVVTNIHTQK